jgi:hypothetical protein
MCLNVGQKSYQGKSLPRYPVSEIKKINFFFLALPDTLVNKKQFDLFSSRPPYKITVFSDSFNTFRILSSQSSTIRELSRTTI